jgi:60 kDa SS-A/Ro ribonucleoprotein
MVKRFAHIIRSGVTGRKSFGTALRNMLRAWIDSRTDDQLFRDSVGGDVSLKDLIKMVRPKPRTAGRQALYCYLLGKDFAGHALPDLVSSYEKFKQGETKEVPDVPFQFLTSLNIDESVWKQIALNAPWHMTRMNLNTFARHNVFEDKKITNVIAKRLCDKELIAKSKVFPYQLMAAYAASDGNIPDVVRDALQEAMEIATANVPVIEGQIYVFPDVSGSMSSPITGHNPGAQSKVTCHDVAALVSAVFLRQNKQTRVIPFEQGVVNVSLNARDAIVTNAKKLSRVGGGGTNCSAPLSLLNKEKASGDLCIYVSDSESWVDATNQNYGTATLQEWEKFRVRNKNAKLVCIDLTPRAYGQTPNGRTDILNVGGFSDTVFDVVRMFYTGELDSDQLVGEISKIKL